MNNNGRLRVSLTVVAQIIAWIVGVMLAYGAVNARVSVLEEQYDHLVRDVQEIKADIKTILRRGER